jgi:hypothetical protein
LALAKARVEREARAKLEALAENESRAERAVDAGREAFAEAKANFEKMTQTYSSESVAKAGRSHEND